MLKKYVLVSYYLSLMLLIFSLLFLKEGVGFYHMSKTFFIEWELCSFFSDSIIMSLLIDWMSLIFGGLVMMISGLVIFYSTFYMAGDSNFKRFIFLVYLFVLSMIFLIFSPNMISILLGWDGLGLVSYCLVIYYQNVKSASAGMLTILSNRVGDVAILLSISWLLSYGSWNFFFIQYMYEKVDLFLILVMVILAGMTKSAQIPFSAWLPAAMAAPTPVSALVHSSTLVTAGVYLLIRFHELLSMNFFLFYLGVLTMFMSGLGANFEFDLKKIIALSTLSQLGVMMMILGLGSYELSFLHLMSHALFKSLLFLCAGVFIHSMGDTQDIRYISGLHKGGSLSTLFFLGCSLSLCGFPFLSGFYSKDLILEYYFMSEMNFFMFSIIVLGTLFTASYSVRLGVFLFFKNSALSSLMLVHDDDGMLKPMMFLFSMASVGGSIMVWQLFPDYMIILTYSMKMFILLFVFLVFFMTSIKMMWVKILNKNNFLGFHFMAGLMWFMPFLSTSMIMPTTKIGKTLIMGLDQGWVEFIGGQGSWVFISKSSSKIDYSYFLNMNTLMFIILLVSYMIFLIY